MNLVNTQKVKARIIELGLTQEGVAQEMGLNYVTLNLKINNKRRIYLDEVIKLCKILKVTTSKELKELFGIYFLFDSRENATTKEVVEYGN